MLIDKHESRLTMTAKELTKIQLVYRAKVWAFGNRCKSDHVIQRGDPNTIWEAGEARAVAVA